MQTEFLPAAAGNALTARPGKGLPAHLLPLAEYLATLPSERSRRSMLSNASAAARALGHADAKDMDWRTLNEKTVRLALSVLASKDMAPSTVSNILCCMKGICTRLFIAGILDSRGYGLIGKIRAPRGSRLGHGRALKRKETDALFSAMDGDFSTRTCRDAAIFALMCGCGLRRAECAGLRMDALHLDEEEGARLTVIGKGNKERSAYLPEEAEKRLRDWLELRGEGGEYVFVTVNKYGDADCSKKLSDFRLYAITKEWAARAKLASWSPHDLRRTYATRLIAEGTDLVTVRNLMGHASVSTTQIYDRRGDEEMRRVASGIRLTGGK